MAIVRTSYAVQSEVETNVDKLFQSRKAFCLQKLTETELGDRLYLLSLPSHIAPEVLETVMRASYGHMTRDFYIKAPNQLRFGYKLSKDVPMHTTYNNAYGGYPVLETHTDPASRDFLDRYHDYLKVSVDHKQVKEAFQKLLNSVPTLNRAVEAFPELENYISSQTMTKLRAPSERAKAVKVVPATIEDDVRATLIKAKILADTKERPKT